MPRDATSHLLAKLRIHPNLNFTDPSNYETTMDNNQLALGPLRQHQEALDQQINRPIARRNRIVVKSPMGRALLTIASVLTRPPVIIMTINAINIAKYSVEQFRRKSYVNHLLFYAWGFCCMHGLASLVQGEPFSQHSHSDTKLSAEGGYARYQRG